MIEKLLKLLKIKFAGELSLKDGTMIRVDGDLAVGAMVYVQTPDAEIPLPSGSYELETGEVITVEDGVIKDITDVVDTAEAPAVVEAEVVDAPVDTPVEEPVEDTRIVDLEKKLEELASRLDALEASSALKTETNEKLTAEVEFIKQKTLAVELKKSKDVVDNTPLTRMDVIKNLKNNKK